MIADDHEIVRQALRAMLELETDFTILGEARDGVEAVELSEHMQPDVLILDISMPNMNGFETIPRVRQVSPRSRIVILTNHSHWTYVQEARNKGVDGYVHKGVDSVETLIPTIRKVVS